MPTRSTGGRNPAWCGDRRRKKGPEIIRALVYGGAKRDRTVDLLHAMQALSQLSYSPETLRSARNTCVQRLENGVP